MGSKTPSETQIRILRALQQEPLQKRPGCRVQFCRKLKVGQNKATELWRQVKEMVSLGLLKEDEETISINHEDDFIKIMGPQIWDEFKIPRVMARTGSQGKAVKSAMNKVLETHLAGDKETLKRQMSLAFDGLQQDWVLDMLLKEIFEKRMKVTEDCPEDLLERVKRLLSE